ncbi:hypothetical protein K402DRAFT_397936 [Aulographum hederae CBS 113979]|uniref:Alcohol acetyltransferase n=1 Tax=Aulographum hederae CBS 113979 TaxID=1176131 RepID=A0A6G1GMR2_9PEZI|nr:hypothetical protein K402DRAFT_397936 [Aulographum hederae CBS 113979]
MAGKEFQIRSTELSTAAEGANSVRTLPDGKPLIKYQGKLEEISAIAHHIDFFTNTGLAVHYRASQSSCVFDLQQVVYKAAAAAIPLHPVLFAVPVVAETKEPYWGRLPSIDLQQAISFVKRSQPPSFDGGGRDRELDALLEKQHNTSFKSGYGTLPVWRLIILQDYGVQHQFTACFIAHHSMSDGAGLQIFHNSFQKALCDASFSPSSLHAQAEYIVLSNANDLIAPFLEELHPLPLPDDFPNASGAMPNEWTGSPIQLPCKTRYTSLSLPLSLMKSFTQECRRHKVAPTAALPSLIAKLLYNNLPPTTEALTCNLPVSLRGDLPPKVVDGVMGNYIDAFKIKLLRSDLNVGDSSNSSASDPMEIWIHARKIQDETRRYFANTSPSGQPYTNIAFFKLIPDLGAALTATLGQPRAESFEVSNMGTFSPPAKPNAASSAAVWQAGKVMISRCAYAAGGPLVVCVLSGEDNIGFGFTWQDGAIGDDVVESVVQGVKRFFDPPQEHVEEDKL